MPTTASRDLSQSSNRLAPNAAARSRYRDNVARHLIGISRDLQSRVMHALAEEAGYAGLRLSFGPFVSLLWNEGRPITAIAADLGITKQATSQLANLIERAGYLERHPHPHDRRSKVVSLTRAGRSLAEEGLRLILRAEAEYAALVGAAPYRKFTAALAELYRGLDFGTRSSAVASNPARRSAGVLPLIAERIQRQLMDSTIARGHGGLKMSHGQVLPLIGPDGGRIHEIARIQGVSRQAISTVSQDLEALGYLRRESDPRDRRGVVLELTQRGERLIADSVRAMDELELAYLEIIGSTRLAQLRGTARDLYQALHLEEEIFEAAIPSPAVGAERVPRPHRRERLRDPIEQLATRLRRQLGSGDATRLAELLEPRARRTAT